MQKYKNIYFSDFPAKNSQRRNITLAFGENDSRLYEFIQPLSSQDLREAIGHSSFFSLEKAAKKDGLSTNAYCLYLLNLNYLKNGDTDKKSAFNFNTNEENLIKPLQATFNGGKGEPLHHWYPYLEGYSPEFVKQILKIFAPSAKRILDPFAGTGTTPITVAQLGLLGFYSELNPLLQFLIEAKVSALTLGEKTRSNTLVGLEKIRTNLSTIIESARIDWDLNYSYKKVFGKSDFFDEPTYKSILRIRGLIDEIACSDSLAAKFLTIAVLASLVPASKLIRRGDLRFKNENELRKQTISLVDSIKNNLFTIIKDIGNLPLISEIPLLLTENSKDLGKIPITEIDAVVTSPPYLNGTNYFRNTKVELWFLRCLNLENDLAKFRFKAVTAGINDVTVKKISYDIEPDVQKLVETLGQNSYDKRIPQMVANYFTDMKTVFSAIKEHLNKDAILAVDIGDSSYGGVHVPTDKVLISLFNSLGFELKNDITLRKRLSRNSSPLRQALLVFSLKKKNQKRKKSAGESFWSKNWENFKSNLPHQKDEFAKRNWGHSLHSLCSYQGKMKPSIAHHLIKTFVPQGGRLLDPFGGVGTIPFEAALNGIKTFTFDISPMALKVTQAKLSKHNPANCERLILRLGNYITENQVLPFEREAAQKIQFNGKLSNYFNEETFNETLLARRFFLHNSVATASECLVFSSLLHILHGNRPYALSRNSHPITPFAPTGSSEYRALIPRLREKVQRSLNVEMTDNFVEGHVFHQDATSWWHQDVNDLDAIITSPPFFDSTRFYLANWMRLWFCGWEAKDFQTKPLAFVDEKQKSSLDIYNSIFRQSRERLKTGGVMVLHLGKSKKCDMAAELAKLAKNWFRVANIFSETVEHCESHGIRDKGTVTSHQYLVLY